jgi:hypothetical protein
MTVTAIALVTAASCGGGVRTVELPRLTASPSSAKSMPARSATVKIVEPKAGEMISGADVIVVVEVSGLDLIDAVGSRQRAGAGHIVYYAGTAFNVPVALHRSATFGGTGTFVSFVSSKPRYRWSDAAAGRQTFAVQLVSSDNLPLDPPQVDSVTVTVKG